MSYHLVPKHAHLALQLATENASAPTGLNGQFLNLCELDYWNGTVLNVAHGMTPVCMEFMHVLLQYPANIIHASDHFPKHIKQVVSRVGPPTVSLVAECATCLLKLHKGGLEG
jgi:hypothetical protein